MLRWECLLDALPLLVDYDRVFCARAACVGRGHDYALDVKWAWSVEQEEARGRRRLLRPDPMGPHVEEYEDPVVWDGFEWVPNPSTPASRGWAPVPAPTEPAWGSLEWACVHDSELHDEWVRDDYYMHAGMAHFMSFAGVIGDAALALDDPYGAVD